jgi:hypothetical protein
VAIYDPFQAKEKALYLHYGFVPLRGCATMGLCHYGVVPLLSLLNECNFMPLAQVKNGFSFFYHLKCVATIFCIWILCTVTFQLSAQTLKQQLNDLPIIDVNIASFHFPPNAHRTSQGQISGKAVETIRTFCTVSRMNCKVFFYPTARAYMTIENGSSDVLMTANIPVFKDCCTYTKWSYPFIAGLITELATDEIPVNETLLEGNSLVMVRGYQSIYEVYPNLKELVAAGKVELIETSSIVSAVKIYGAGRASILWGANVFEWYFEQLSMQWKEENFKPLVLSSAGIWVSKKSEHQQEILNRFNLAYQLLREQGNLDKNNFLNHQ